MAFDQDETDKRYPLCWPAGWKRRNIIPTVAAILR